MLVGILVFNFWRTQVLFCGANDSHVLDFWWCFLWVSKPEWAILFTLGRGICGTHYLSFTFGATPAHPMWPAWLLSRSLDLFRVPATMLSNYPCSNKHCCLLGFKVYFITDELEMVNTALLDLPFYHPHFTDVNQVSKPFSSIES